MTLRKHHQFILIEIFIALALLTLCTLPLISSSLQSYLSQKKNLLSLELERQAELYFYQVLKEITSTLNYDSIPTETIPWTPLTPLELSLGETKNTYYPHYHLYYKSNSRSETHKKVWCELCFPTQQSSCFKKSKLILPYKFAFLAKKVAENSSDQHGGGK